MLLKEIQSRIEEIQRWLIREQIDGWLLYDHHNSNPCVKKILDIPLHKILSRRFFYWIPQKGEACKIVHTIEAGTLEMLPGREETYLSWQDLQRVLGEVLKHAQKILMEYSPQGGNPYVSLVDAGTWEMVHNTDVEILSSADLMQHFTSVLNEEQMESHREAAGILQKIADETWQMIAERLRTHKPISELYVQNFILDRCAANGCVTSGGPICAINEHAAMPHYVATQSESKEIKWGDFILIDLWCKKERGDAVYADIARVAVAADHPTQRQIEIFNIVKESQTRGIEFLKHRGNTPVQGRDVDDVCRHVITSRGFGPNFTHRTGHNIDSEVHGAGAHLDNFECSDYRQLLPGMCFTIEPGIYLSGEFGIRLETDILILPSGSCEVTGGVQENIVCLGRM